jgi:hypothetical protein
MKQTHLASSQGIRTVDLNEEMRVSSRLCFRVQQSRPMMNSRLQASTAFTHRHATQLANVPLTHPAPLQASEGHAWHPEVLEFNLPELRQF